MNNMNNGFCPKCGNKVTPNTVFCSQCGTRIIQQNPQQQNFQNAQYPNNQQYQGNQQGYAQNPYQNNMYQNGPQPPVKDKKPKPVHILLIIVCVLAVLFAGILIGMGSGKDKNNTTATETSTVTESETETTSEKTTSTTEKSTAKSTTKTVKLNGISSHKTYLYVVGNEYDAAAYVMMSYVCNDTDIDGYEVRMTFPYNDEETETYYVDKDWNAVYYGSQDPSYTVEIRSYKGNPESSDCVFSKWTKLCDEDSVNSKKSVEMSQNKWDSTVAKDGYQLK